MRYKILVDNKVYSKAHKLEKAITLLEECKAKYNDCQYIGKNICIYDTERKTKLKNF